MGGDTGDVEAGILARLEAHDEAGAATLAIRRLGPPILGYIVAVVRDEDDANEVFSMFCEDLWRGIGAFRRESSFKTWAYKVAWHATLRLLRDPSRRRGRALATNEAEGLAAEVRSTTALHLRTGSKDALADMRAKLLPEEQALLVLRIDRDLSWSEIADVLGDGQGARAEAALRKRFERLKEKLRKEAVARGLLKE
jgi:RNA polymerase sigma-70 factor (ECF subfamily)